MCSFTEIEIVAYPLHKFANLTPEDFTLPLPFWKHKQYRKGVSLKANIRNLYLTEQILTVRNTVTMGRELKKPPINIITNKRRIN